MALVYALTLLAPLVVGVTLPFLPFAQRRHVALLRVLLTVSMLPWLTFLSDIFTVGVPLSLDDAPSLTWSLFVGAAAPGIVIALAIWVWALLTARRAPLLVTSLPMVIFAVAIALTLEPIRGAALLQTAEGEPYSGFIFDGLYGFWYLVFSVAAGLGLLGFVASAYWSDIRQIVGCSPFKVSTENKSLRPLS